MKVSILKDMGASLRYPLFQVVRQKRNAVSHHQSAQIDTSNAEFHNTFEYFNLVKTFIYAVLELKSNSFG